MWVESGVGAATPETQVLVNDVIQKLSWTFFAGVIVAAVLAFWRLRAARAPVAIDDVIERLARGDTSGVLTSLQETAAGGSPTIATAVKRLQGRDQAARELVTKQRSTLEYIGASATTIGAAVSAHEEAFKDTKSSTETSRKIVDEVTNNIEGLSKNAEATSSSILQMVAINNEVTENIHNLAQSVQETTTAIEEMTFSVKEVAKNIEELSTAAEETAASMNEMDVSISQVETNANETSRLSETVTVDAETGVTAIGRTMQGIDRIKESSRIAANVIGALGQKIDEIGNILTVIDDVAEQTNLLALNAAIIAAQAGEHGRGFAVVADEIKALAERTGASTKEIADLIKTVQSESKNAITTMSEGVTAVEEGVQLGHNAEAALLKIVDSAKRSTLMIKAIAQATVEQAKGSKQVTNSISRIAETVQQIALATSEQAKGSEQIMRSAERMRSITQQVERSTEEQNRGGQQVTQAVESIRDAIERLSRSQENQLRSHVALQQALASFADANKRTRSVVVGLEQLLTDAGKQLEPLAAQLAN
ncbi:MAG: chemotaxis protein [Deltaproteobacteria bacterium]|nr:chemotaxis protein [Deltaproteobacteria bacterium]